MDIQQWWWSMFLLLVDDDDYCCCCWWDLDVDSEGAAMSMSMSMTMKRSAMAIIGIVYSYTTKEWRSGWWMMITGDRMDSRYYNDIVRVVDIIMRLIGTIISSSSQIDDWWSSPIMVRRVHAYHNISDGNRIDGWARTCRTGPARTDGARRRTGWTTPDKEELLLSLTTRIQIFVPDGRPHVKKSEGPQSFTEDRDRYLRWRTYECYFFHSICLAVTRRSKPADG